MMRWESRKLACVFGLSTSGAVIVSSTIAAAAYCGQHGQHYSPLNHFISELGEIGVSQPAWFFNASLVASGLLLVVFISALAWYLHSKTALVGAVFGVIWGLSTSALGLEPLNHLDAHIAVAICFFNTAPFAIGLLSVAIHFDPQRKLSRWLAVPAGLAVAALVLFDVIPILTRVSHEQLLTLRERTRPTIWPAAILEWLVLASVLLWIVLVSSDLAYRRPAAASASHG